MKKIFALAAAALLACVGGLYWWSGKGKRRGGPGGGRTIEAARGPIEQTLAATGSVVPLNRVEVRPPIGGRVEELLVREGDRVQAGTIIAWLSSNDRAAILDAARAQGEKEFERWKDSYKPTPVVAPLSGLIILRNAVVGQTVEPSTTLFAIADTLIVVAQVDESEIGRLRPGVPTRILLDAYPGQPVLGKIFDILYEGKSVSSVITYGVKIRPNQVPAFFRSQMTANVNFILGKKEDALLLPAAAVQDSPGSGKRVLVPGPEGPEPKAVTTGIETGDQVEILTGLQEGDRVVLARGRYTPPEAPQSSPLSFGGRGAGGGGAGSGTRGEAPRPRRRSQ